MTPVMTKGTMVIVKRSVLMIDRETNTLPALSWLDDVIKVKMSKIK